MAKPPHRRSRPKKLNPEDEALLYNVPSQPAVAYPPVVLPAPDGAARDLQLQPRTNPASAPSKGWLRGAISSAIGIRRAVTQRRVQVGLDFGTSSTKVMYRVLGVADASARALSFGHGLSDYPEYCLPSLATFDRAGNLLLADTAAKACSRLGWGSGLSRVKMLIAGRVEPRYLDERWNARFNEHVQLALGDSGRCTPEALAATFLAFVMRRVRQQLERSLGSTRLDLIFNTCVPVDQSERTPIVRTFERVLATAAALERSEDSARSARACLDWAMTHCPTARYDLSSDDQRVFLMPEAVATAAGYISSLRRRPGLHAIVDIGAGTTDVSICQLSLAKRTGATTDWYAARSIPMGASRIEGMIAHALADDGTPVSNEMIYRAINNDAALAKQCGTIVSDELKRMWNGTVKAWSDAYGHNATQSAWSGDSVTVFLAGGGAQIPAARSVFSQSWMSRWGPYPCDTIPTPETFAESRAPFYRLSVAFGLSIPLPELGRHVYPSQAPDHTPPKGTVRDWRQDGDQMLPRWGWT